MRKANFVFGLILVLLIVSGCKKSSANNSDSLATDSNLSLPFLVIDLDGDGVEILPLEESNVFFDVDGDGMAEKTAWISPGDAFLMVATRNEYQSDMSYMERIVNNFTEGGKKLQNHDKNHDFTYDEADYQQFKNQSFRDLIFMIATDEDLNGIPKVPPSKKLDCDFISLSFTSLRNNVTGILKCKNRNYSFKEMSFIFEDENVVWGHACQEIRNIPNRGDEFKNDCVDKGYLARNYGE